MDYQSVSTLTAALQGQDAVISTLPVHTVSERPLIDAAIAAGVKRFLPSEFGCDSGNPKAAALPWFHVKLDGVNYLLEKAPGIQMTYTRVVTGGFLDWCLAAGLFADAKSRQVERIDGGDRPTSTTTLAGIGQAIVGVLKHPNETENKIVRVQSAVVTQNKIMRIMDKVAPGPQWDIQEADSAELEKIGRAELQKEDGNKLLGGYNLIKRALWGDGYGGEFPQDELDNELLGVHSMSEQELEDLVSDIVKKA